MTSDAALDYAASAAYTLLDRRSEHLAVLLHGLGGNRTQPLALTPDRLESTGVSVLAPDARAHGETSVIGARNRFTGPALAEDVVALIDRLGLADRRLAPVGISMGAAVALQLLRSERGVFDGAVLVRPSFGDRPWLAHHEVFREIAAWLRSGRAQAASEFVQSETYRQFESASPAGAASLLRQFGQPGPVERVIRLETVPGIVPIDWDGVWDPGCPVTIVGAEGDPQHPVAVAQLWHQRIADSELEIVPSRDADPQGYAEALASIVTARIDGWCNERRQPG
jgi:pimeloyl-ACP methyl ester carboxylesterase